MAGGIYSKPVLFTILATIVILVGTVVTMFYPMFTPGMHPKLDALKPYTALELAGKDIYQREGCNNCHTQTVRPLRTEVMRYGEYSKAGEFAYDRPFLWGSKRTGPDLARIGGKYPDAWHVKHFNDPQEFYPRSNMPSYGWLAERGLKPSSVQKRMEVNGFPYTETEIELLEKKTEFDALVAYMQVIGRAVTRSAPAPEPAAPVEAANPLAGDLEAIEQGEKLYADLCAMCHGDEAEGDIGPGLDDYDASDPDFFEIIGAGIEGEMPGFVSQIDRVGIWSIITYLRSLSGGSAEPVAPEADSENPLAGDPEAVEEGEEIYTRRCAMCHGQDLAGSIGPSLVDGVFRGGAEGTEGAYFRVIREGSEGGMPPFGGQLGDTLIWSVVSYIKSEQAKR